MTDQTLKYDSGPWYVAAMNDTIYVINKSPPRGHYDKDLKSICCVGPTVQDEANAYLIAAVPELMDCLVNLEGLISQGYPLSFGAVQQALREARKAIAKTTPPIRI